MYEYGTAINDNHEARHRTGNVATTTLYSAEYFPIFIVELTIGRNVIELDEFYDFETDEEVEVNQDNRTRFRKVNNSCKSHILGSLSMKFKPIVAKHNSAINMYRSLLSRFTVNRMSRKIAVIKSLARVDTMSRNLLNIINTVERNLTLLKEFFPEVPTAMELGFLHAALPEDYEDFSQILVNARDEDHTWDITVAKLLEEEARRKDKASLGSERVMITNCRGKQDDDIGRDCKFCGSRTHISMDCYVHPDRGCPQCRKFRQGRK